MLSRIILGTLALALFGCNQQLEDFVAGAGPKVEQAPPAIELETAIKRSPGAVRSQGGGLSLQAHITPTAQTMTGNGVSARVGISSSVIK